MSRTTAEQRREQIRNAAYQCFRDHGYHETSVDTICEAAGISKGSFYWSFDSKQAVLVDIIDVWTRQVMDELYEQFQAAVLAPDYMDAITAALARESRRGRTILPVWVECVSLSGREPRIQAAMAHFHGRLRTAIAEMLRPALVPRLDEAALQSVASGVLGAYVGLVMQEHADPGGVAAEQTMAEIMGVLRPWLAVGYPVVARPAGPEQS